MLPQNNVKPFSILLAIHEQADSIGPFIHALSLASIMKGELEIIDVRRDCHHGDLGVRRTFEQWRMLPAGSNRSDVGKMGINVKKILKKGHSEKAIGKRLERRNHDLLVIGTDTRSGFSGLFGQYVAEHLAQSYRQTTLYVPGKTRPFVDSLSGKIGLKKILIPITEHPCAEPAIKLTKNILHSSSLHSAEVTGFHVGESFPVLSSLVLENLIWNEVLFVPKGDKLVDTIIKKAHEQNPDLIVMTTNGRDTFTQKIMGSITEHVLRETPCPVLAVAVDSPL
ncbi:MAG: hypothetical protein GF401_09680 [Chitinivibrionales bacterium]|nr:hypothetical protein [Chitinivibrionales bacterium]